MVCLFPQLDRLAVAVAVRTPFQVYVFCLESWVVSGLGGLDQPGFLVAERLEVAVDGFLIDVAVDAWCRNWRRWWQPRRVIRRRRRSPQAGLVRFWWQRNALSQSPVTWSTRMTASSKIWRSYAVFIIVFRRGIRRNVPWLAVNTLYITTYFTSVCYLNVPRSSEYIVFTI